MVFPSKLLNSERREVWIHKMRRVSATNTTWNPGESDMVCSEHFVDGYTPVENLDPTSNLGYVNEVKKQRRALVRQAEPRTPGLVE